MIPELVLSTADVSAFDSDAAGVSGLSAGSLTTWLDSLGTGELSLPVSDELTASGRDSSFDSELADPDILSDSIGELSGASGVLSGASGVLSGSAGEHSAGVGRSK